MFKHLEHADGVERFREARRFYSTDVFCEAANAKSRDLLAAVRGIFSANDVLSREASIHKTAHKGTVP